MDDQIMDYARILSMHIHACIHTYESVHGMWTHVWTFVAASTQEYNKHTSKEKNQVHHLLTLSSWLNLMCKESFSALNL